MQSKDWWKVFRTLQGFDWSSSRELYIHRFLQHFLLYYYRSYPPTSTKHWSTNEMQISTKLFQGIEIYKREVFTILELLFADDTLFCTNTEQDLQLVIETFSEVCGWFGIQISVKKTEVMIQRPLSDPTLQDPDIITINGEQLSVCSSFKYLGNMITNDALLNVEIKTRIGQATAAFSKLFQRVWSNKSLSLKTKISTYKTSVLPILIQD